MGLKGKLESFLIDNKCMDEYGIGIITISLYY